MCLKNLIDEMLLTVSKISIDFFFYQLKFNKKKL